MKSLSLSAPALSCRAAVTAAVAALALTGCANYSGIKSDKQMSSPAQYESSQSLPSQGGQWPSLDWANQFGDPQLPQLIAEALEGSPSIAQAQARIAKASSYIESSRSALYPKVNGSYSWNREIFSANSIYPPPYGGTWYSENNVLASASWDLDLWGKNRQRLGQAVSQEKAAEADMQQARVTLAASVASTYNQLAQLYALRDIAAREIANRQDIGAHHERPRRRRPRHQRRAPDRERQHRHEPGQPDRSRRPDHHRALSAGRAARQGTGSRAADRQAGPDGRQRRGAAGQPAGRSGVTPPGYRRRTLAGRSRDARREGSQGGVFPGHQSVGRLRLRCVRLGQIPDCGEPQMQFGPAIHLPIFDAGALRSQLKGRYADFDLDVANYNQTLINALSDVATQIASIRSIDQQSGDAQRALDASTKAYQLAVIRYKAGLSEQLQVLTADQNRLAAEQTVTNLKMRRRDMQIGLIKALGGGFDATQTGLVVPTDASARPRHRPQRQPHPRRRLQRTESECPPE